MKGVATDQINVDLAAHTTAIFLTTGPVEPFTFQFLFIPNMISDRKSKATRENSRIARGVVGMFIVVLLTAMIGHNQDLTTSQIVESPHVSSALNDRIAAFRKGGPQKNLDRDYDIEEVIEHATSLLGTPHLMGGYSSNGIDCSGLVSLAHAKANVELPRSSHDQARYGTIVFPGEELKRGDLVFFHSTYQKEHIVTHSGIYLGNDEFIHASTKLGVTVSKLNSDYYRNHYLFATRLGGQQRD